jgi:hypothetical protein
MYHKSINYPKKLSFMSTQNFATYNSKPSNLMLVSTIVLIVTQNEFVAKQQVFKKWKALKAKDSTNWNEK